MTSMSSSSMNVYLRSMLPICYESLGMKRTCKGRILSAPERRMRTGFH